MTAAPHVRWQSLLVTLADWFALERDAMLYGDTFVKPTGDEVNGEPVYRRIAPSEVRS